MNIALARFAVRTLALLSGLAWAGLPVAIVIHVLALLGHERLVSATAFWVNLGALCPLVVMMVIAVVGRSAGLNLKAGRRESQIGIYLLLYVALWFIGAMAGGVRHIMYAGDCAITAMAIPFCWYAATGLTAQRQLIVALATSHGVGGS